MWIDGQWQHVMNCGAFISDYYANIIFKCTTVIV